MFHNLKSTKDMNIYHISKQLLQKHYQAKKERYSEQLKYLHQMKFVHLAILLQVVLVMRNKPTIWVYI